MFGALRLALASIVVIFHAGYSPLGVRIGVSAVVVFFMLSGYVISGLYATRFISLVNARHFYIERLIRIAPQYYFYLLLTLVMLYGFNLWWFDGFPARELSAADAISNLMLIPMGLLIYFPGLFEFAVIGQASSLALELLFYLLVPVVFVFPIACAAVYCLSAVVFCLATHGEVSMVAYSYNYLPGPLVFFIIGHLIYRKYWRALALALLPLIINQFHLIYVGQEAAGFNRDLYVGMYGGLIAIFLLKELSSNSVDYWMGAASYGCFLGHYSILIALRHYGIFENSKFAFACLLLGISIFVGLLSFLIVEKPTLNFRRKWRIAEKEKI